MIKFQIFIIFHKTIFDECYSSIPQEYLNKYFTFVAVNNNITKEYTENKYKIINEWDLLNYNENFQNLGYLDNSVIYHIYANNLHKQYEYIGFFQYDMFFEDNFIDKLEYMILNSDKKKSFELKGSSIPFNILYNDFKNNFLIDYIINDYEIYFDKKLNKDKYYPLFNAYIIPSEEYNKCMSWVSTLYDKIYDYSTKYPSPTHYAHIAGVYERIMALFIADQIEERYSLNIIHEHNFKNKISNFNKH
jgi:hypothetical protein